MSTTHLWSPPQEPQKPPIPYQKDSCLRIRKVEPPHPFARRYWEFAPQFIKDFISKKRSISEDDLKQLTMVKFCLSQKALPCKDIGETTELRILESLAVKDGRGAQVFTCTTSNDPSKVLVAKVYDPLYYPFIHDDFPGTPLYITTCADSDFTGEAAAYAYLDADHGGGLIPRYYGAWAFTQPLLGQSRTVNLILMEYIHGVPLSHVNPTHCTKDERLNVIAKVMEAKVILYHHGVNHRDLAPRNIIVGHGHNGLGDSTLQLHVIDFNRAEIFEYTGFEPPNTKTLPVSPATYWEGDTPSQISSWIYDDEVDRDIASWNAWIRKRWGKDPRFLPPTLRS